MFLFKIANLTAWPLAATADEIQPWMIAAIAIGALLALILIIVAARKSRAPKGEDLRESMAAAKQQAAEQNENWVDFNPSSSAETEKAVPMVPAVESEASATKKAAGGKKSRGKHAK